MKGIALNLRDKSGNKGENIFINTDCIESITERFDERYTEPENREYCDIRLIDSGGVMVTQKFLEIITFLAMESDTE